MKNLKNLIVNRQLRKKMLTLGIMAFLLLVVVEIWALNRLSTFGEQITRFEKTSNDLQLENQILQNRIASLSSLREIQNRSLLLGFRAVHLVDYFKPSDVASAK
ncbi:hypothetical protein A2631_02625 [Candidatus Daviesbacteria bacterium RIFCSPHIGHO2_01_FULL_44_29]|uniref:Cell division protein FtsL n=1 Tax=Candidatus Daviesbacteria bacterium RIFCSPHIGHO2_02_FULL_43_12 TaxID=1797776 RepID=A0A1F5KKC3_9BACT|nr:MAG: hypothetical protein A2631_02625 [Candidatus Daviesbacteria bacterium RIFCSPHIGHO2_01_FULL_44_29]OGE40865.1 MAG: hypothetical protein A3E86_02725 [Candidatus Daviesbacteria bacterium RIFCSPHIGHO2_12_FULL_47_45]OGE41279.1 MAG: hypothetical protein A3D25_02020 [Candidatus Daviesbacteria bacterium RIFCSPHIGHO2_02_FULL_43_12]OGE69480.1 MAG: hypothetical protein A3B55_03760 [Candidatus Daviesbacteria bacterium RIFCSPLOWO2_01_FULL_43_15]